MPTPGILPKKVRVVLAFHEWNQAGDWRIMELRETPRDERLVTAPIDELHGIMEFQAVIEMDDAEIESVKEALKIGYAPEFRLVKVKVKDEG